MPSLVYSIAHGKTKPLERRYPHVAEHISESIKSGRCPFCGRYYGSRTAWHMLTTCSQAVAALVKKIRAGAPEEELLKLFGEVVEA